MNATHVARLATATLSGTMPFPDIVGKLLADGVECYRVDYRALQFTFYGVDGGVVSAPLVFEGLPDVAESLDLIALRSAIHASQTEGQRFRDFCCRAMLSGVQSYFVFLTGRRVIYLGRQGDEHVERFP